MISRFLKSTFAGIGGGAIALGLFVLVEFGAVWVKVQREKATGIGAVAGGIAAWPLSIVLALGFVLAFVWMWRRS